MKKKPKPQTKPKHFCVHVNGMKVTFLNLHPGENPPQDSSSEMIGKNEWLTRDYESKSCFFSSGVTSQEAQLKSGHFLKKKKKNKQRK